MRICTIYFRMSMVGCPRWLMDEARAAPYFHLSLPLLTFLLCCCIVLQVLGTPISVWNVLGSEDLVQASLLEGFSTPSHQPTFSASSGQQYHSTPAPVTHEILLATPIFHPPPLHAS